MTGAKQVALIDTNSPKDSGILHPDRFPVSQMPSSHCILPRPARDEAVAMGL